MTFVCLLVCCSVLTSGQCFRIISRLPQGKAFWCSHSLVTTQRARPHNGPGDTRSIFVNNIPVEMLLIKVVSIPTCYNGVQAPVDGFR